MALSHIMHYQEEDASLIIQCYTALLLIKSKTFVFLLQIVRPVSAIIIVDVQNDFISGSLSLSNCPAQQVELVT